MTMATTFMHSGRRLALAALLALSTGTTLLAQTPMTKLDARLRLALARTDARKSEPSLASAHPAMRDVFLSGDPAAIRRIVAAHGGVVHTVAGTIVTARVPESAIREIARSVSVERIQGASPMRRFNETAARSVDAVSVWTAPPSGRSAYTGKGVIVGIIDTGIDWSHPDFRDPNDSTRSRIIRIWDQNDTLGRGAGDYDYGTEWTKEQIDAALRTGDTAAVRHRDNEGHGTHVSGTAAGNGLATGHNRGMAFDADIAMVALNWQSSTSLVDAAAYLFDLGKKLGRPVVINMSLGTVDAPRDGSDAVDLALDNLVKESSGRAVCIAAGNLGDGKLHWGPELSQDGAWTYVMHDPTDWGSDPKDGLSVVLKAIVPVDAAAHTMLAIGLDSLSLDQDGRPTPHAADTTAWMSIADIASTEVPTQLALNYRTGVIAGHAMAVASPEGEGYYGVYIIITDLVEDDYSLMEPLSHGADFWRVMLKGSDRVHMWAAMGWGVDTAMFDGGAGAGYATWDNSYSVTSPGTSRTALTVGAYSNVAQYESYTGEIMPVHEAGIPGELAVFSSVGPSFDGRMKPEIVAPGHGVISCLAQNLRELYLSSPESPVTRGGYHAIFSGTSMACPVVTGSVALYFEKNPTASYDEIKDAITRSARTDEQTASFGPLPNAHWGFGKLDIYHAIYGTTSSADAPDAPSALALEQIMPNPASTTTMVSFSIESRRNVRLEVVDIQGVVRATLIDGSEDAGRHEARLDATTLDPGVYTVRLTAGATSSSRQLTVVR